jgi:hypothetical protein
MKKAAIYTAAFSAKKNIMRWFLFPSQPYLYSKAFLHTSVRDERDVAARW